VVILLALAVVGGVWMKYTWKMDFMTPPSEARLEEIRQKIESSFPRADVMDDAISVPAVVQPPPPPPKPSLDFGDLTAPPKLKDFGEFAPEGADHLIMLARALESKGEFQRALLAWERVIDLTEADGGQAATAVSSIKRLRPTLPDWNLSPESAIQIELHAGTGKNLAKKLTPVLESVARELERASSGILKVEAMVTVGKTKTNNSAKAPVPVALWLTGPGKDATSTDVLSFTVDSSDVLPEEVSKTVFQLIRGYIRKSTDCMPPGGLGDGVKSMDALTYRVTRLSWREFGGSLNVPPKKDE